MPMKALTLTWLLLLGATNGIPAEMATNRYYELRCYTVTPGKLNAVLERFRDTVEPVRRKHGINTVGYWTGTSTNGEQFVYLLAAPSQKELERQEKEFGADPDFQKGYAASNAKHGKTVDQIEVWPLGVEVGAKLDFTRAKAPRAFDLRIYSVPPAKLDAFRARWRDHASRIYKRHGLQSLGWWVAGKKDAGGDDLFACLLAGDSVATIERATSAFHADPEWQRIQQETEVNGRLRSSVKAYLLVPADFSPLQ